MSKTAHVEITVNGEHHTRDVEARTLLVGFLRDHLGLTGAHVGCDTTNCGACTVHVDGESVKSCTLLAAQCDGAEITTVEGLAQNGTLHPVQQGFWDQHGLQCGYCTPGMIMSGVALLEEHSRPSREQIIEGMNGNICRCGTYQRIIAAVQAAAGMEKGESQ